MIINPFVKKEKADPSKETEIFNKDSDKNSDFESDYNINDIQKYIIDNYIEYINQKNYSVLINKIEQYIYTKSKNITLEKLNEIKQKLLDKMFGYYILQKYIDDENVTDIRVVKYNLIFIKSKGKWHKTSDSFIDENDFHEYVRYCVLKNNANINFDIPLIVVSDKKYNLRIEAGIPPVNAIQPSLVIRIHRHNLNLTLERLFIEANMFDTNIYKFFIKAITQEKNLVICGRGGSGKTSLLRAIIEKLPDEMSITTNEETIELYIEGKNIIQREVQENRDDSKKITLEKLTRHSLVMSNQAIILGELKGKEAAMFFDALATGHIGYTTIHSNGVNSTIDRLITLIKRDKSFSEYKEEFIAKMLADSIDYIIFMKDYKVYEIASVIYNNQNSKFEISIIFKLNFNSIDINGNTSILYNTYNHNLKDTRGDNINE